MKAVLVLVLLAAAALGREEPLPTRDQRDIKLDIASRRIVEEDYQAHTEVGLEKPLELKIGAGLRAEHIQVDLEGVTGLVHFRADLARLTQRSK